MRAHLISVMLVLASLSLGAQAAQHPCALTEPACLREVYSRAPAQWPAPQVDAGVAWQELGALPERAPAPEHNPYSEQKAALGRTLFFDPRLSRSGQLACASCHEPDLAFADGRRVSFGHDRAAGRRNAPSVVTSGLAAQLFWDGRADSLEMQALMPVVDPKEMAFSVDELVARLRASADYPAQFAAVFPGQPLGAEQIGAALATYQRELLRVAQRTPFERFLRGRTRALSDEQLHGLHLFRTKARCMNCHFGAGMSDNQFHNAGLTFYGRRRQDLGRHEVTGRVEDVGRFRTPSLRLVSRTGPWFHNGFASSLDQVLVFYNVGMPRPLPKPGAAPDPLFPVTSALFQPLGLDRVEMKALKAFLEAL